MNRYTVVLRYPDFLADDFPDDVYFARVQEEDPKRAVHKAKVEAQRKQGNYPPVRAEDFHCITVIEGWPAIYGGDELTGTPRLWAKGQGPAPSTAANPEEEDTP